MGESYSMPVAVHIFLLQGDYILMSKRKNTGYEDGKLCVVGGDVESGESIYQTAIREIKAKVGVDIDKDNIKPLGVMHRNEGEGKIDFFFLVERWRGTIKNLDPDQCEKLVWVKWRNLPCKIIGYVEKAVYNWWNKKWLDVYGW